jgi:hypothetical protein
MLIALLLAGTLPTRAAAQDLWYKVYLDGVAAFEKHDYATAEQKLRASIDHQGAPPAHGPNVLLFGQLRGFEPERYLTRIYLEQKKYDEAAKYLTIAEKYAGLKDTDRRQMESWRSAVNDGLSSGQRMASDDTLARARAALQASDFSGARTLATQAATAGASSTVVGSFRHEIDLAEFDSLIRDGARARDGARYSEARDLQTRARALNIDAAHNVQAETLATTIANRQQFDGVMADLHHAVDGRQWSQAKTLADQALALAPNDAGATALKTEAERHVTFEGYVASARQALDQGQIGDARQAVTRARALNVDPTAVEPLAQAIDIRETSDRLRTLLQSRSYTSMQPLVDRLATLDPRNPLIVTAQQQLAATLGNSQRERLGLSEFYRGRYDAAAAALTEVSGDISPRVRFYLACSKAALSLIETDERKRQALEAEARRAVDPVRQQVQALGVDRRYVSPGILAVLKLTNP